MKVEITLMEKGRLKVRSPYSPLLVDRFRIMPGARYDASDRSWSFPAVKDVALMVCDACGLLPSMLPSEIREAIDYRQVAQAPPDMRLLDGHEFLTKPYEHQRVGLARLLGKSRWLIADEQGAGKTFVVCNRLKHSYKPYGLSPCTLIVCPKSVLSVWEHELMQHAGLRAEDANILVTNYEKVRAHIDFYRATPWQIIVIDEIHRLKNFTSQTSKAVRKLTARAKYVWGLSGTPAPNGLEDWLGVLSAIDPTLLPVDTKTGFEARYCLKSRMGPDGPFVISGYRNVEELHNYVQSITSRVTKAEALDLPPKVFSTRTVALEGETARIYRDLKKDAVARVQGMQAEGTLTVRNVLTESMRLLQVVGGFVPDDDGTMHELKDKPKLEALADVLDEYDGQAVIWCCFLEEVKWLARWLEANYGETVTMTGDLMQSERAMNISLFQAGRRKYLVGTPATGGAGITLHAADLEVYYSRNYNLAEYLQSIDRLHRIGQVRTVNIVKLIAMGTVDVKVDDALERKASLQEMLLMKPEEMF